MEGRPIKIQISIMVALLAVVTGVRFLFAPWFGVTFPFATFLLGTIIVAWATSWRISILNMVLGTIIGAYFFCQPPGHFIVYKPHDLLSLTFFWVNGGLAILVTESMRVAQKRARHASHDLVDRQHELSSRIKQQEVVGNLGQLAITSVTCEDFFESVTNILSDAVFVDYSNILRLESDDTLTMVAGFGWRPEVVKSTKMTVGKNSQAGYALTTAQPVIVEDLDNETRFSCPLLLKEHGVHSGVSVTIPGYKGPWGVLGIHSSRPRLFSVHDIAFVQAVASLIAACLERHRLTKELQEQIDDRDQLTKKLQRTVEDLATADRRKDDFMAMLAHELRNPLAPIQNCTSILSMEVDSETVQWALDTMHRQVQHMVRLVDDLLDVSRIMHGRIDLKQEVHDLQTILFRAIETSKPVIEAHGHRFTFTPPSRTVYVDVDEVRMAQVVSNLLNNAAKYTSFNGTLELAAELIDKENVIVTITDSGCGIEEDLLPHVFEPFIQADRSLDRSKGGLGIGLALVKSLVEMHGGQVDVTSTIGQGSKFTVTLPMSQPGQQGSSDCIPTYTDKGHVSRRILVVDDNSDAAMTLTRMLNLDGHQTKFVFSGPAALDIVGGFRPDIILLDIGLPEMNGYEVCQRLRELPGHKETCIIALTGYGTDEHRKQAFASGFSDHVVKPVQYQRLQEIFDTVCKRKVT